MKIQVEVF